MEQVQLSVSDFLALTNQTLENAYPSVTIEGEVSGFKINQGKFVFFDIKDTGASVGCFMMAFALRVPIEDGMKVIITASPKLTHGGKFSLTVRSIRPSGEGALKKSFDILKAKLDTEGLFADERKRRLPRSPQHIAVISSTQAAGYADFIKIINDRWGGVTVDVAHVQVQGAVAPDQIIHAINYFNQLESLPEVLVIIRGGGSADDLSAFNDEPLVRAIAASRIPTLVGVGHEIDESLADLVADVRAATPSNAAQIIVPDKQELIRSVRASIAGVIPRVESTVMQQIQHIHRLTKQGIERIDEQVVIQGQKVSMLRQVLTQLDPHTVLARGYSLVRGQQKVGAMIEIETNEAILKAEVHHVSKK